MTASDFNKAKKQQEKKEQAEEKRKAKEEKEEKEKEKKEKKERKARHSKQNSEKGLNISSNENTGVEMQSTSMTKTSKGGDKSDGKIDEEDEDRD